MLPACDLSVSLLPENASFRDCRGLARALTGDRAGAVEDFRFFIEHTLERSKSKDERRGWIASLEQERDPFDESVLRSLGSGANGFGK